MGTFAVTGGARRDSRRCSWGPRITVETRVVFPPKGNRSRPWGFRNRTTVAAAEDRDDSRNIAIGKPRDTVGIVNDLPWVLLCPRFPVRARGNSRRKPSVYSVLFPWVHVGSRFSRAVICAMHPLWSWILRIRLGRIYSRKRQLGGRINIPNKDVS